MFGLFLFARDIFQKQVVDFFLNGLLINRDKAVKFIKLCSLRA